MGHMYLIIIDAHSKWLEVLPTSTITAQSTVRKMKKVFATHGLPHEIVTDNGTPFYWYRVPTVCDTEWYLTYQGSALPPIIEWPH